jgi:hypothetical protein
MIDEPNFVKINMSSWIVIEHCCISHGVSAQVHATSSFQPQAEHAKVIISGTRTLLYQSILASLKEAWHLRLFFRPAAPARTGKPSRTFISLIAMNKK